MITYPLTRNQVSKKLVNSDFKNHRVDDPTKISEKQLKNMKKYVKEFFDKAVAKKQEHDKKKAQKQNPDNSQMSSVSALGDEISKKEEESDIDPMDVSDEEVKNEQEESDTPATPFDQTTNGDGAKRKRHLAELETDRQGNGSTASPSKRVKSQSPPSPPPPPPPPADPADAEQVEEDVDLIDHTREASVKYDHEDNLEVKNLVYPKVEQA
jgi:[histone H3]-lysine36 N-trimethyltransferase